MRLSKFFFKTFKESPQEAEVISHKLLERGGYLKKLSKGLFTYTPLLLRVLNKITTIVREELNKTSAQEISMPLLHPKEIWERTGRWDDFKSANLLYTLEDREDHEFCLSPTHEETVVLLVQNWITSYKQLPFNLYQIGAKFRDEIRPRFGLIRCKEFIMKDAYSFSASLEGMEEEYQKMRAAYIKIFSRLDLDFVVVEAHAGKIGKGKSEEFQVKASIGEDAVMVAGDKAYNVEAAKALPPSFTYDSQEKPFEELSTPNCFTIEDLSKLTKMPPEQILKTVIYKLTYKDKVDFVAIGIRGDREVNEVKVATQLEALEIEMASEEEVKKATGCKIGFAGPLNSKIPFFADLTAKEMKNFVAAGNKPDLHYLNVNWSRDVALPSFYDFLTAKAGDICPENGVHYEVFRGIEVGHVFSLGTLYSEKLGALFQNEKGDMEPFWMGCYGIGIGRLVSAIIEQRHDEKGIIWPLSCAPFRALVTAAVSNNEESVKKAEEIYQGLQERGFEPLLDDRDERLGLKLKDSDLWGIPFKIIIGKAFKEEGKIEIESRKGEKTLIPFNDIYSWAEKNLNC